MDYNVFDASHLTAYHLFADHQKSTEKELVANPKANVEWENEQAFTFWSLGAKQT